MEKETKDGSIGSLRLVGGEVRSMAWSSPAWEEATKMAISSQAILILNQIGMSAARIRSLVSQAEIVRAPPCFWKAVYLVILLMLPHYVGRSIVNRDDGHEVAIGATENLGPFSAGDQHLTVVRDADRTRDEFINQSGFCFDDPIAELKTAEMPRLFGESDVTGIYLSDSVVAQSSLRKLLRRVVVFVLLSLLVIRRD